MTPTGEHITVSDGKGGTVDLPVMEGWLDFEIQFVPMGFALEKRGGNGPKKTRGKHRIGSNPNSPIEIYRLKHNLTQEAFAKQIGTSGTTISMYERGARTTPERILRIVEGET